MIAGCDEAGRGPVFGNLVLCGVLLNGPAIEELKAAGVRDSKLISPRRREMLAELISQKATRCEIIELSPVEIDDFRLVKKINLNELEAMNFAKIIDRLRPELAYLDSPDPNPVLFERRIRKYLRTKPRLVVENFADRKYAAVAAASIVAKVRRDRHVAELRERYGDFGSGYPADPRTIAFLENWVGKYGELPEFARRSWETAKRVKRQVKHEKLE